MCFRQLKFYARNALIIVPAALLLLGGGSPEGAGSPWRTPGRAVPGLPVIQGSITGAAAGRDGTVYIAFEEGGYQISKLTPDGQFLTVAGSAEDGKNRYAEGPGEKARFDQITGIAIDSQDRLKVLDCGARALHVVDPSGTMTTLAGKPMFEGGRVDGYRCWARFFNPVAMTEGQNDMVYVIDGQRGDGRQYFRKIAADGSVSTISVLPLGMKGGGDNEGNRDIDWNCLAAYSSGRIFIAATEQRVLIEVTADGRVANTFAPPLPASENSPPPWWLAAGPQGYLYLADSTLGIYRMDSKGTWTKLSGTSDREILAESAPNPESESILAMVIDPCGRLILVNEDEDGARMWVERLQPAALVWRQVGGQARMSWSVKPEWIWQEDNFDDEDADLIPEKPPAGQRPLFFSEDMMARRVREVNEFSRRLVEDPQALAGFYGSITGGEGIDPMTWVERAIGNIASSNIALDGQGNILVAEARRGTIIRVSPQGRAEMLAEMPRVTSETQEGDTAAARVRISVSPSGSIFVIDSERDVLFQERLPNGRWNVFSEDWIGAWSDSNRVNGLLFDAKGNVYLVPDPIPGRAKTEDMPKVNREGGFEFLPLKIESLPRTSIPESIKPDMVDHVTQNGACAGMAGDGRGGFFTAHPFEHVIRKRAEDGTLRVFAGRPLQPGRADGAAAEAQFFFPFDVAADSEGNVFVADTFNHVLRKILPNGDVSTFAGVAGSKGRRDGWGADARFDTPTALAVDRDGALYVLDQEGSAIRKVTRAGEVTTLFSSESKE
jgi:hypothetical protein